MTFYVVNLYILILKVLRFISKKNFCQSCTNILISGLWSVNQKILSPSNAEDTASVHSSSSPAVVGKNKFYAFATMRRFQFVQPQICFCLMLLGIVDILGELLYFSLWVFLWQTWKSQRFSSGNLPVGEIFKDFLFFW